MANKGLNPGYVSLHQHSIGSLRDGIMKISDHVKFALDNEKKFVAITDHGSVSEWIELYTQCSKTGIKPIYGIEGYVHIDRDRYLENKEGKTNHVVLLALNETGFKNIIKIHNDAWKHFYRKPIMSYDFIEQHSEGVVVSSACLGGTLPRLIENKEIAKADEFIERMKASFPERFFIELIFIESEDQYERNRQLVQIAKKHDVPLLVNSDAHYVGLNDAHVHQLSLLLQSGQTVKDLESGAGWTFSAQDMYLKTEKELYKHWSEHYKDDSIVTIDILCEATWNVDKITSKVEEINLEHPPRLPHFKGGEKTLTNMIVEGFTEKVEQGYIPKDRIDEYSERVEYELKVIKDLGLIDYFLLINDIVEWCSNNEVAVGPGRGCFLPGSKVLMADGSVKKIKDVSIGDRILNRLGNDIVENRFEYEADEDIINLTISGETFGCTKDHEIEVIRDNKKQWVKASEIEVGDNVVKTGYYS